MSDQRPTIHGNQTNIGGAVHGPVYSGTVVQSPLPAPPAPAEILAAQRYLAQLPIEQAAQLPAAPFRLSSMLRLRPGAIFVGRDQALTEIATAMRTGEALVIATGLGGVGKTQLAVEAAHRYGKFFAGGVFWISCADPPAIAGIIAAYGGPGALELWQPYEQLDMPAQLARVLAYWATGMPCLLIFDNCDDRPEQSGEAILRTWLPTAGACRVLVTSRRARWDNTPAVRVQPLSSLERSASIELLQSQASSLSSSAASAIAQALGDLPLALHLAGSYMRRYGSHVSVEAYLEALSTASLKHESLQGRASALLPTEREPHVEKAFALSFAQLMPEQPIDALSMQLLVRLALCAPGWRSARLASH